MGTPAAGSPAGSPVPGAGAPAGLADPGDLAGLAGPGGPAGLGVDTHLEAVPASPLRFPDGGAYRIEIPSVEGPQALAAVIEEAERLDVPVHRVSQGSGVLMLRDGEIRAMLDRAGDAGIETCLFVTPRAAWDIGAGREVTGAGPRARGAGQLRQAVADARRAADLGVRCLLLADEGVLWTLHQMRYQGTLPSDLRLKISALAGPLNPASFAVLAGLGADSVNVPADLTVAQLAQLRAAADAAIDVYVESPDDAGGFVRHHEAPEIVRSAAPIYLKFGLRNAAPLYPCGQHLTELALHTSRERVRRARLCLDHLERANTAAAISPPTNWALPPVGRFTGGPRPSPNTGQDNTTPHRTPPHDPSGTTPAT